MNADLKIQVGGTIAPGRAIYIQRPEDRSLKDSLADGEYACVFASRQVGKSSLMLRTALQLKQENWKVAFVDLSTLGSPTNICTYLSILSSELAKQLGIKYDAKSFWSTSVIKSPSQRFKEFVVDVILYKVNCNVAIFLDEVDSTSRFDFTDDLFLAIRSMYNDRGIDSALSKIVVCLAGVAQTEELIKDVRATPYNIGIVIEPSDFNIIRDDLSQLESILRGGKPNARGVLHRVFYWTDGHPFLTMAVLKDVTSRSIERPEDVDGLVSERYFESLRRGQDVHFRNVERLLRSRTDEALATLRVYERVLKGNRVADEHAAAFRRLRLLGLVKKDAAGLVAVRNRIYERVFDRRWVKTTVRGIRRVRPAESILSAVQRIVFQMLMEAAGAVRSWAGRLG